MKLIIIVLSLFIGSTLFAQVKTEKIKVSGNCGMCKKNIETAAKKAGATKAIWNAEAKLLTVIFEAKKSNTIKIEKAIAKVGYDTANQKGSDAAYNKLAPCCHYRDEE